MELNSSSSSSHSMEETKKPFIQHSAHTQSKLHHIMFKWTVNNFSFWQLNIGQKLESPIFSADTNEDVKWSLALYPNGHHNGYENYLTIFLFFLSESSNEPEFFGKFKISVLSAKPENTHVSLYSNKARKFRINEGVHSTSIPLTTLLDKANGFLPEDMITILCEINYITDTANIYNPYNKRKFKVPERKITDDFGNLVGSQKFSDVTLLVGEHEFPAHRAILAARSEVFAAMFEHEMEERKSGRVIITDVKHAVLQELLNFIYTGNAPKIKSFASDLLAAADKYNLIELTVMCEEALFAELSIENAAEILILSNVHNAVQLKDRTIEFINNNLRQIQQTNGWKYLEINHENLKFEILEAIVMTKLNIKI